MPYRPERVRTFIKEQVGEIIQHQLKDPRIGFASVTDVEVSMDLRHAKVFISVLGDAQAKSDCLGSALALQLALARIGRTAQVGSADGVPEPFRVLPGAGRVLTAPPAPPADVAVAVECSTVDRAGTFAQALLDAATLINIDHH